MLVMKGNTHDTLSHLSLGTRYWAPLDCILVVHIVPAQPLTFTLIPV